MTTDPRALAARCTRIRTQRKWTRKQVAERIPVSVETLRSWEVGRRNPSPENLNKWCAAIKTAQMAPDWPRIQALYAKIEQLEIAMSRTTSRAHRRDLQRSLLKLEHTRDGLLGLPRCEGSWREVPWGLDWD